MDPLSITTGIITLLQTFSTVIKYINDATGATKERKRVREALRGCESIVQELKDEADDSEEGKAWSATIKALEGPDSPIGRLLQILHELEEELQPKERRIDKVVSSLKWPFKESDITKLLEAIESEKSLLQLALKNKTRDLVQKSNKPQTRTRGNWRCHIQLVQGDFQDETQEAQRQEERQKVLNWLTPINYGAQHSDFIKRREKGTGTWLLESAEFVQWVQGREQGQQHQTLFCPGIPGAGKTIITSITVDYLNERFRNDETVGIAYAYCNFRRQGEQKAEDLLASILKQLASSLSSLPDSVKSLFASHERGKTRPSLYELCRALTATAGLFSSVFIIIDALDECNQYYACCSTLISKIFDLQETCGAKFFATSRFITDITDRFKDSTTLEIQATDDDVRRYVHGQIGRLPRFVQKNPALQDNVKDALVSAVKGMFLLAQLHLNSLVGEKSPKTLRAALAALPAGSNAYDCAYNDAMERIEGQTPSQASLAKQALMWIACAKCALSTLELQHALAVEVTDFQYEEPIEFDQDNISDIEDVVSVCAGLVTVDEKSDTIRLVHYTTQQYFERTGCRWFPSAEADITSTCLTYLSFSEFEYQYWREYKPVLDSYPFLIYAAKEWAHHAHEAPTMRGVIVDFLRHRAMGIWAMTFCLVLKFAKPYSEWSAPESYAPRVAIFFDLEEVLTTLLCEEGCEATHTSDGVLLREAATTGHRNIVSFLLRLGYNVNSVNYHGETALWLAIDNGHEAVAQLLIENGANLNHWTLLIKPTRRTGFPFSVESEKRHLTPISHAAWRGMTRIVKLLLDKGIDPNFRDNEKDGRTPLMWAAIGGCELTAQLLLDKGANLDMMEKSGDTAFSHAVLEQSYGISVLLLNNGVQVDSVDAFHRTALHVACYNGDWEMAELLVKRGANVNIADCHGTTPLHEAAVCGHETIAKLLLDNGVDVNRENDQHETPLWEAIRGTRYSLAKLLLDSGAHVNPMPRGFDGKTLLSRLSETIPRTHYGLTDQMAGDAEYLCRFLLEQGVDVDVQDMDGRTALWWAARRGAVCLIKPQLEWHANLNLIDKQGKTPLCAAAYFWDLWDGAEECKAVTKLLLENGADVDYTNEQGETILWLAAQRGDGDTVNLLSELGADVNRTDKNGVSPLQAAIGNGHNDIVRDLLSNGALASFTTGDGITPRLDVIKYEQGEESASVEDGDGDGEKREL